MLEYKGYVGQIAYDDIAEVLYARVINSGPYSVAEAEATDVEGVKREFRKSIDLYLASCAEDGVEPLPPTEVYLLEPQLEIQPFRQKLRVRDLCPPVPVSDLRVLFPFSGPSLQVRIRHVASVR